MKRLLQNTLQSRRDPARTRPPSRPPPHRRTRTSFATWRILRIAVAASLGQAAANAPATAQDQPLSGDFEELCRVGGPTAPEWAYFEGRSPAEFDAAGSLHVLDAAGGRIVVVDSQCGLVRTVGRKGEGPGEFNQVAMFAVWRDGRVAVMDMGHAAYQVFGSDGELEHFARMSADRGPMAMFSGMRTAIRPDPGGGAVVAQGPPAAMRRMSAAMARMLGGGGPEAGIDDRGLERIDLSGDVVSGTPVLQAWRVPLDDGEELDLSDMSDPAAMVGDMMNNQVGFEAGFHWDVLPDGTIAWSDSTAYAIKFARPEEAVHDVVERPFSPEPVTARIRQAEIERTLAELEDPDDPRLVEAREMAAAMAPGMMDAMREAIEEMDFRDEVPVVRGLKATWEGGVWVQRRGEEPWDDDGPVDVFDSERGYLGTLGVAGGGMPAAFGPDGLVAYWELDELDVPTLVLRRLPEGVR